MAVRARAQDALIAGQDWRYLPTGYAAHAVPQSGGAALCGASTAVDWLGAGSPVEEAQVAVLPRCRKCLRRLAQH
jgi:hypothetical protein